MKKIIIKATSYLLVLGLGIWIGVYGIKMIWGKAESNLKKSEIVKPTTKTTSKSGNEINDFSILEPTSYFSEKGDDISSSEIKFIIEGDIEPTEGKYKKFDIELNIQECFNQSEISVNIDANSIYTGNDMRDDHLKQEDFFNVTKYPEIKYTSSSIITGDTSYIAIGTLEMMGMSKELTISFQYNGTGVNDKNEEVEVFEGKFSFDRTQYGMQKENEIADIVDVIFYTELTKQ